MHEVQRAYSKMKLGTYACIIAALATCLAAESSREPRHVYELDLVDTDLPDSNRRGDIDNNYQYFDNSRLGNGPPTNAPAQIFPIGTGWLWNANPRQNNANNNRGLAATSSLVTFPPSAPTIRQLSRNILLRQLAVRPIEVPNNNLPQGVLRAQDRVSLAKGLLTFPLPPEVRRRVFASLQLPVQADVNVALVASPSSLSPVIASLHGPIAMGSGSLGYARTPTGALAIGSGAIGYTSFEVLRNPVIRNV